MDEPEERFGHLYETHIARVLAFALRRVPPPHAVAVMAETFAAAWWRLDDAPAEPLPWLIALARARLVRLRRGTPHLHWPDPDWPMLSDVSVSAALRALRPLDADALTMIEWDKLSLKDTAAALGAGTGETAYRLTRARRQLRGRLEPPGRLAAADPLDRRTLREWIGSTEPGEIVRALSGAPGLRRAQAPRRAAAARRGP